MKSTLISILWLGSAAAQAQSPTYFQLPAGPQAPAARYDGALAWDPTARTIYMFGGQGTATYNDLWRYSLETRRWSQVATVGSGPSPRFGHTLVFDSARRRLIVFAGQAGTFYNDVWALNIATGAWGQLDGAGAAPLSRYGHGAIYDAARDRMVITHGFTTSGRFDDTWAFDFKTNQWKDISPADRPLKRCLFHSAYDAAHSQMYIFGGCASGYGPCPLDDLWAFDLANQTWSQKSGGPPARQHYGLAFDSVRGRLVVFDGGGASGLIDDDWEFDSVAQTWSQPHVSGASGGARQRMGAVYVPEDNATYFFGGQTAIGLDNSLWRLGIAPVPAPKVAAVENAFSFAADAAAPGELVSIFGSNLGWVNGTATGFDSSTGQLPTGLADVSVTFNGLAAPLYYVRADQINAQVPYELAKFQPSTVQVAVTTVGGTSAPLNVPFAATHPGLAPVVFNQDGSLNSAANPAPAGSVIVLFATGQGVTSPAGVTGAYPTGAYPAPAAEALVTVGGRMAAILFVGLAPQTAGVTQINARLPDGLGAGAQAVVLQVGAAATRQAVNVYLK